jgi:hypothetical protein
MQKKVKRSWETSLDGTGSNHPLLQVLLVLADAAVPAGDGLVLAHHDVLGDLVEESVRDCVSMRFSRCILSVDEAYLKS